LIFIVIGSLLSFMGLLGYVYQVNSVLSQDLTASTPNDVVLMSTTDSARIWVDVGGAVKHPGIYRLGYGARLADVVELAGGFSRAADNHYLNKELNLAQILHDGQKIYIPTKQELRVSNQVKAMASVSGSSDSVGRQVVAGSLGTSATMPATKISINQATISDLESLKGVGEVRAQKIIDNRPYTSLDDLVAKKVLSEMVYRQNLNQLSL
jgi:competence protein ComEA